ncbi:MAG: lipid-binding SYLF domain-containing protein [Planctomycetota bacterium]|jgi:lipid-binding SYLF domain-containing protein
METRRIVVGMLLLMVVGSCSTVPKSPEAKNVLSSESGETLALFKEKDPGIQKFFDRSYGYAVLPKVLKGGFWVGGASGQGEVFEQNQMVGYCRMSQATLGFSFGGEYFREIIFFRDKEDLDRFKSGDFTFSAQVTGVALKAGAAAKADYKAGMAVFVMTDVGLMVDASLGGQKFKYVAKQFQD